MLGKGTFGEVYLIQNRKTKELTALKVSKKETATQKRALRYIYLEGKLLEKMFHPFIVKLRDFSQSDHYVFLQMDYLSGGELYRLLFKNRRFNNYTTAFYAGEVILAL
mmetsp:Transcript_17125/g.15004  ORF Transcript_17125/g.15004 Transcript_17125/m.15004 type:complete len:108 (-) Transcript_17125:271-594(-)|eukprot:CAMPEP_0114578716 /NCGR_PEP_ID=MMETSP0125-20121206/3221_1 /TAXON_ID=485358 ORGANISM="Aristerostoma sp., Strain ATCC 50986" /NCGR_SAMPLE_ID=MMETSP0125 /ASSEMBLY_ACC=CAM_ASM_000245 /LENGTH=107 /DNA_ID=CAMNT_0001768995 /DNA_START=286 /DNA_END=609 /DNA_ORIENTATION=+